MAFSQHIIKHFRVDFLLVTINRSADLQHRLAIECDGAHHLEQVEEDAARDQIIRARGYDIVRFSGSEIVNDVFTVIEKLRAWICYVMNFREVPAGPLSCASFFATNFT
jgi:very-short-patch-repair endonuclease